jgi:hypothetical protein
LDHIPGRTGKPQSHHPSNIPDTERRQQNGGQYTYDSYYHQQFDKGKPLSATKQFSHENLLSHLIPVLFLHGTSF